MILNKYFIYRHIRLDINQPFYIGIGTKNPKHTSYSQIYQRAYTKTSRSKLWFNVVNKTGYEVEVIFESDDQNLIFKKEIEFINLYGRKDFCSSFEIKFNVKYRVIYNALKYKI